MLPPPLERCWRHSVLRLSVRAYWKFVNTLSYKHLWEFHQICNFGAVGDKDELIRFSGQRSRSQQHHKWSNKHVGGIFSPLSRMLGRIFMQLITVTHYQSTWHWWHFQSHGYKGQVTDIFQKFSGRGRVINCSLSMTIELLLLLLYMYCGDTNSAQPVVTADVLFFLSSCLCLHIPLSHWILRICFFSMETSAVDLKIYHKVLIRVSDVNKDWTLKDKDKDLTYKDKD